jgi:hypothetical protein
MAKDPLVVLVANVPRSLRDEMKSVASAKGLKLGWIFADALRKWLDSESK